MKWIFNGIVLWFKSIGSRKIQHLLIENNRYIKEQINEMLLWPDYKNTLKYQLTELDIKITELKIQMIMAFFRIKEGG